MNVALQEIQPTEDLITNERLAKGDLEVTYNPRDKINRAIPKDLTIVKELVRRGFFPQYYEIYGVGLLELRAAFRSPQSVRSNAVLTSQWGRALARYSPKGNGSGKRKMIIVCQGITSGLKLLSERQFFATAWQSCQQRESRQVACVSCGSIPLLCFDSSLGIDFSHGSMTKGAARAHALRRTAAGFQSHAARTRPRAPARRAAPSGSPPLAVCPSSAPLTRMKSSRARVSRLLGLDDAQHRPSRRGAPPESPARGRPPVFPELQEPETVRPGPRAGPANKNLRIPRSYRNVCSFDSQNNLESETNPFDLALDLALPAQVASV